MNQDTVVALEAINREFYRRQAGAFSATRRRPWPGWTRVLDSFCHHGLPLSGISRNGIVEGEVPPPERAPVLPSAATPAAFDIVDAGCGNGRLASLLVTGQEPAISYLGVDSSASLVAEARRRHIAGPGFAPSWVVADLVSAGGLGALGACSPGLTRAVVVFGLLHHVAAGERRRSLVSNLAGLLEGGGLLAVSFWQFGDRQRFLRRRVPWEEYNRHSRRPIDVDQLEPGDWLLAWGEAGDTVKTVRYCHHTHPEEAALLVEATGLEVVDTFAADGRSADLNLYYVLRKPSLGVSARGTSR